MARRRLRIPQALAVVLVTSSATVAVSFAGCGDAGDDGATPTDAPPAIVEDPNGDIGVSVVDAGVDARPDARPDAPRDAYVPPDTPVH